MNEATAQDLAQGNAFAVDTAWTDIVLERTRKLHSILVDELQDEKGIDGNGNPKRITDKEKSVLYSRAYSKTIQDMHKKEYVNGVRNPSWDDPEWGYPASKKTKTDEDGWTPSQAQQTPTADNPAGLGEDEVLWNWLGKQTWSEFAQSLHRQYSERGTLSPKQWAAARKMKATMDAKAKAKAEKPEQKATGLDLHTLPSGYYAVPGGDTRLKVRVAHGKPGTKWDGWTFVSDGAEYGQRKNYGSQRPDGMYRGDIETQLEAILEDPEAAMRAYGKLTGSCGACGRLLEDEDSIAAGIGPVCAQKF